MFKPEDILPVPCHPDCLAMAYALEARRQGRSAHRPDRSADPDRGRAQHDRLRAGRCACATGVFKLFATNHSPQSGAAALRDLLCCLPRLDAPAQLGYQNIFRVLIMQFIDAYSFDVRSVKKTCVHIVHPDGRLIPFDTYNLFYRDGLETRALHPFESALDLAMEARPS